MHVHICICLFVCINVCQSIYIHACVFMCIYIYIYTWTHMRVYMYIYIYIYIYIHMNMCVYIYIYIYIYGFVCVCAYCKNWMLMFNLIRLDISVSFCHLYRKEKSLHFLISWCPSKLRWIHRIPCDSLQSINENILILRIVSAAINVDLLLVNKIFTNVWNAR